MTQQDIKAAITAKESLCAKFKVGAALYKAATGVDPKPKQA